MNRIALAGLACLACLLTVTVATANALMIAPPPVPMRVAAATAAYLGKVTAVPEKAVKAEMFKGDERQMKVATVRVGETLIGKGAREVKVGFFLPAPPRPGGPIIPGGPRRFAGPQLTVGQEGILMLHKHPTMKDVYVFSDMFGYVPKAGNPGFAKELAGVKAASKVLAAPMKALKSKDAAERYQAAALLVARYKTPPGAVTKTEKVPAAEAKLILDAIANADWKAERPGLDFQMSPTAIFSRLGVADKDGFKVEPGKNYSDVAKKWLEANAGKYEMTRYVREAGVSEEPGPSSK